MGRLESIRTSAKRVSAKILNPLRSTSRSRARVSRELLFYWLGMVAVIILAPFRFSSEWMDLAARMMLFVPLGFLFPLTVQGRNPKPLPVFALGLLLGIAIAAIHPSRATSVDAAMSVVASAVGAGVGAYILQSANRQIASSGRLAGRLSLEIPLVALIYMLLPVLLTTSLLAAADPLRAVALIPLGLLGARLIAAAYEYHFAPAGVFHRRSIVAIAAGWMTLGVFPIMLVAPAIGIGVVLLVAFTTFRAASIPVVHLGAAERRFEADTLRKAVPAIATYFVIVTVLPLASGASEWNMSIGLTGSDGALSRQLIALLASITSVAMLGYVLAEGRGRRELPFLRSAPRIAAECGGVALLMEVSRGFQEGAGFSLIHFASAVAASVLGAGIYHSQRERLQWILINRPAMPPKNNISLPVSIGQAVSTRR